MAGVQVRKKLNPNKRKNCFELYGLDYIIDADHNVWMIEVNTNPCLEESSALLSMLLPRMIDDMFKLTVDRVFPYNAQTLAASSTTRKQIDPLKIAKYPDHQLNAGVAKQRSVAEEVPQT